MATRAAHIAPGPCSRERLKYLRVKTLAPLERAAATFTSLPSWRRRLGVLLVLAVLRVCGGHETWLCGLGGESRGGGPGRWCAPRRRAREAMWSWPFEAGLCLYTAGRRACATRVAVRRCRIFHFFCFHPYRLCAIL